MDDTRSFGTGIHVKARYYDPVHFIQLFEPENVASHIQSVEIASLSHPKLGTENSENDKDAQSTTATACARTIQTTPTTVSQSFTHCQFVHGKPHGAIAAIWDLEGAQSTAMNDMHEDHKALRRPYGYSMAKSPIFNAKTTRDLKSYKSTTIGKPYGKTRMKAILAYRQSLSNCTYAITEIPHAFATSAFSTESKKMYKQGWVDLNKTGVKLIHFTYFPHGIDQPEFGELKKSIPLLCKLRCHMLQ
ncbi:hypothetical protein K449DRAFT_437097 [Hypoxylon sp. EC38]|nr:hypothetical protein K449DRAFT_437097 [Hypoxylon sp. EC38]